MVGKVFMTLPFFLAKEIALVLAEELDLVRWQKQVNRVGRVRRVDRLVRGQTYAWRISVLNLLFQCTAHKLPRRQGLLKLAPWC